MAGVEAYVSAMDTVFLCGAGLMAVCVLLGLLLPKSRPEQATPEAPRPVAVGT